LIYFLAFLSGSAVFPLLKYFPYTIALACTAAVIYFLRKRQYVVVVLLALGLCYPGLRGLPPEEPLLRSGNMTISGYFRTPPVKLRGGYSQEFQLSRSGERLDVLSGREFETGREQKLRLRVMSPAERKNPGAFGGDQYALLWYVRKTGDMYDSIPVFFNRLRERLNRQISERFEPETASLIMAVTTGHRAMDYKLKEAFRASGLAHLLSISGTHFGLMFLLLFGFFRTAIKYLPVGLLQRLTVYLTPSQAAALICVPFLLLYLGISGARVPTVRSFIMISLFLFGLLVGRKGSWLNFLVLAALVLVILSPAVITSVSFQLSFLAVLFIGFFLGGRPSKKEDGIEEEAPKKPSLLRYSWKSIVVTLSATAGIEPLVAYYFNYSSLVSPAANLIVTPLVCMVLVPLSVAGSFLYLLTGSFPLESVTGWVAGASIYLVKGFSSIPYSSVPVPAFPSAVLLFYYLGFLLYFISRNKKFIAVPVLSVLVPLVVFAASDRTLGVTFLDAGRGDASVVELPDGKVIVVDAGKRGKEVRRYLRRKGIKNIDALVLTHADNNHAGGAETLAWQFRLREIWDNGRLVYPEDFPWKPVRKSLKRGDVIKGEGYTISVLHPYKGFYTEYGGKGEAINNDSLVFRVQGRERSVLFAGDIGAEAMEDMAHLGEHLGSDVLKLSDHGDWGRAHAAFLEAVSPSVAVLRREPDDVIASLLEGARVLSSASDGAVLIQEGSDGLWVKTFVSDVELKKTLRFKEELSNIKKLFVAW
jgi:competence protein ComEC